MKNEQIRLRAELPIELKIIKDNIEIIKNNIAEIMKMMTNMGIR